MTTKPDSMTNKCKKCGGLGKVETMVDCECSKPKKGDLKRILLECKVPTDIIIYILKKIYG